MPPFSVYFSLPFRVVRLLKAIRSEVITKGVPLTDQVFLSGRVDMGGGVRGRVGGRLCPSGWHPSLA